MLAEALRAHPPELSESKKPESPPEPPNPKTPVQKPRSGGKERGQILGVMGVAVLAGFICAAGGWFLRGSAEDIMQVVRRKADPKASTAADPKAKPGEPTKPQAEPNPVPRIEGDQMPEEPKPEWIKPDAAGRCRDPQSGQVLPAVVLRKGCYGPELKRDKDKPCPNGSFDPPPEVMNEPKLTYLRDKCFYPYYLPQLPRSQTP